MTVNMEWIDGEEITTPGWYVWLVRGDAAPRIARVSRVEDRLVHFDEQDRGRSLIAGLYLGPLTQDP